MQLEYDVIYNHAKIDKWKAEIDNTAYQALLDSCRILFKYVEHDEKNNRIYIHDEINVTLLYSWNEEKIYVDMYDTRILKEEDFKTDKLWYQVYQGLNGFRFLSVEYCVHFLEHLKTTCNYIRKYQF